MRLKTIGYGLGITIQMQPYEYARPVSYVEVELAPDDDPMEALALTRKTALQIFANSLEDTIKIKRISNNDIKDVLKQVTILLGD
jgi:hypothetical protein